MNNSPCAVFPWNFHKQSKCLPQSQVQSISITVVCIDSVHLGSVWLWLTLHPCQQAPASVYWAPLYKKWQCSRLKWLLKACLIEPRFLFSLSLSLSSEVKRIKMSPLLTGTEISTTLTLRTIDTYCTVAAAMPTLLNIYFSSIKISNKKMN